MNEHDNISRTTHTLPGAGTDSPSDPAEPAKHPRRRQVPLAAAVVLAGAVAATLTWAARAEVTVAVDGSSRQLSTRAGTVQSALDDAHITISDGDRVTPALDAAVADGTRIDIVPVRDLRLTVDGTPSVRRVAARTVGQALEQVNIPAAGAFVSAPAGTAIPRTGFDVVVRTPQQVNLVTGGTSRTVTTTATSVAELLDREGLHPGPGDIVTPHLAAQPRTGQQVRIVKVEVSRTTRKTPITAPTETRPSSALPRGTTRVSRAGTDGARTEIVTRVLHDGKTVSTQTVTQQVTAPVSRVVLIGSAPAAPAQQAAAKQPRHAGAERGAGLNWAALAQCESGGRPSVVSANGLYHGLYQFTVPTWRAVGGTGLPSQASPAEQLRRAKALYAQAGPGQWPVCGKLL